MAVGVGMTAEELLILPNQQDLRRELDEGELIEVSPLKPRHGQLSTALAATLGPWLLRNPVGRLYQEVGFVLTRSPDTLRAPDLAFVRAARLPSIDPDQFVAGAPDLAIEILSPSESAAQMVRKVRQYLRYGAHTVWVVAPEARQVHVYRADGADRVLRVGDELAAPELLPGWSLPLADLFAAAGLTSA